MGVCGTGKTTVGEALAKRLACPFLEGDSFHPPANIEKMSAGMPLDDADRWPWLDHLGQAIAEHAQRNDHVIAACSALKRIYRDRLRHHAGDILFVLLDGDRGVLGDRLAARADHYMPASLLASQLAILERPGSDEISLALDAALAPEDLVRRIEKRIS
jgi:gluconokinase